ncbi:MAG: metallophosphoesterase [Candidatus Babeliales bacterium]
MRIIHEYSWHFPPSKNKRGIAYKPHDIKKVIVVESSLFLHPTFLMSDMHGHTPLVVEMLDSFLHLDQFVVLTAGDMAGKNIYGSDDNPTPSYEFLAQRAREFYFVQGNHDLPDPENKHVALKNKQEKYAALEHGKVIQTLVGSLGGVHGTISSKVHPHKMPHENYMQWAQKMLVQEVDIFMTHETPSLPVFDQRGNRSIGNAELFELVDSYKPKIHIYGHCHHADFYTVINGVHYLNVDARVVIVLPEEDDAYKKRIYKKKLTDMFNNNF